MDASQPEDTIEIMFGISYTNSKVIALNVRMFKDFLAGIDGIGIRNGGESVRRAVYQNYT